MLESLLTMNWEFVPLFLCLAHLLNVSITNRHIRNNPHPSHFHVMPDTGTHSKLILQGVCVA